MVGDRRIKVYFFYKSINKNHTASNNRFWAIYKMTSKNFLTEVIEIEPLKASLNKYKLLRGLNLRFQIIIKTISLFKVPKGNENNVIYLFSVDPLLSLWFYLFSLLSGFKLVSERNELPTCTIKNKKINEKINKLLLYPWYFKMFHGYSFITNKIYEYYKPFLSSNQIHIILPMTVDFSRFNRTKKKPKEKYIFYAGSLNNRKDGVHYLIKAFSTVVKQFIDIRLIIVGNSSRKEVKDIQDLITELGIDNVRYLGQISRDQIPNYTRNALLCVLPRPDSTQASGGFPTKLGEYLASATPVITTNVGEIPDYLTEQEVYYISKNNIQEELAEKIVDVIFNKDQARIVGHNGYAKAKKCFSLESNLHLIKYLINTITN